ncbi:MAG: AAA family ATPase [Oscillospiraceae bacterium]|nr:AAA family ATPase [Oscillospiraceae bacterium]
MFYCQTPPQETRWLWEPYIPRGKITIIQGDPGEGKSTLALWLAAAVSTGRAFPDTEITQDPDLVIYQNAEDGIADTLRPRLDAAGADTAKIMHLNEQKETLSILDVRLYKTIQRVKPALVVLDPLQAYFGSDVDMHRANEVRPVMSALAEMAELSGAAIVLIGHMNKMQAAKSIYRGLGSIDLTAAARSVLTVARDPKNPDNRIIFQVKNSLAKMAEPAAFSLADGTFTWLGEYEADIAEVLSSEAKTPRPVERAKALLKKWLTEYPELPQREIMNMADSEGISRITLNRAKRQLHIRSVKKNDQWCWKIVRDDQMITACR